MATKIKALKGLIYGTYDSETEMATVMGWPRQRLNKISNGNKIPNINEIQLIAYALEKPVGEIAQIFLSD
ncbi:hypothetical protein EDD70_1041 [Hydrogenoanaerobacterium saccharovorans]|uniref:HTH cro/C1-type domain-containing protein n=1 Tax=Hydrogenoanaerobacterium saccharovorans TaxID=474960 RepID=A0A1H8A4M0_9FIRM|nr:helix-turn-helix transcriptional regulator [Hydrogenoanaerobacterium saccharovorans]RPF48226.1 hypothetical protein EDD70_1041 [Hydrogenoanaerobacterium saccharovorans]SEM64487.1 hypothetical protein SAMN05216180_1050 [Hydrogenoanaerobacterium saccharovorans]